MPIRNDERLLVDAVVEVAQAHGWELTRLSHDWLLMLRKGARRHTVFGYDIGLNNATALRVCNDKAASHDVLTVTGLPMIEHRLFLDPIMHRFTGQSGNWRGMIQAFADFGGDVVVKENEGTGGNGVHRVRDQAELERIVHLLLPAQRSIAISPYTPIRREQRFIILDGEILLAYEKCRPAVTGDGRASLRELAARAMTPARAEDFHDWLAGQNPAELDRIIKPGESAPLGWRHNLGQGADARELDPKAGVHQAAARLAIDVAQTLSLRFGSIDIVEPEGGDLAVMEANAGVMLEHYGQGGPERRRRALAIYRRALAQVIPV